MHIEGPWLSSTSTRARAAKITKSQQEELERNWRDRNKRLKGMGLPKQTFEEFLDFVHGRKTEKKTNSTNGCTNSISSARGIKTKDKIASPHNTGFPNLSYRTQSKFISHTNGIASDSNTDTENSQIDAIPLEVTRPEIWVTGPTSSKPSPTYTGTKVFGIGTMHKSNMVPIFSDQEAEDISKMRR